MICIGIFHQGGVLDYTVDACVFVYTNRFRLTYDIKFQHSSQARNSTRGSASDGRATLDQRCNHRSRTGYLCLVVWNLRACISLGRRTSTDTERAGCRRVKKRFSVKNTHTKALCSRAAPYPVRVPLFVKADHAGNRRLPGGQGARLVEHDRRRLHKKQNHVAAHRKKKTGSNQGATREERE